MRWGYIGDMTRRGERETLIRNSNGEANIYILESLSNKKREA